MNYKHKCDVQLAQWLIDCVEEKPIQKKASTVDTTMMPYKLSDRADQLKTSVLDHALEELQAEEEQKDDQTQEQNSDSSDIEKRISEAKTPEELEAIEKELSSQDGGQEQSDQQPSDGSQPEQTDQSAEQSTDSQQGDPAQQTESTSGIESLQKEIKDLKSQIEKLNGEEKMKNDIKELKEKLDNVVVQHNPNLNETIYQTASKIKYFKRAMRRLVNKNAKQVSFISGRVKSIGFIERGKNSTYYFINSNGLRNEYDEKHKSDFINTLKSAVDASDAPKINKILAELQTVKTASNKIDSYESAVKYLKDHGFKASDIDPKQEAERKIKLHGKSWQGYAESQMNMKFEPTASSKEQNEFDDYAKKVAKGIFDKVSPSLKKYMGITEKSILNDIDNEDLRMKMYAQDYYQEDKSVAEAIKGLYKELMDHYHGSAAAM
jgi:hypothetical protein